MEPILSVFCPISTNEYHFAQRVAAGSSIAITAFSIGDPSLGNPPSLTPSVRDTCHP